MNANAVARHYGQLTAWERLPLLLAALNRGDDAEAERLASSTPTRTALVPHHHDLQLELFQLSTIHQMQQMDRAYRMACATALLRAGHIDSDEANRHLRMLAFGFVVEADAWKLLSAELKIDPEAILRHLPGCDLVRDMEEAARKIAFTEEEALAYLRSELEAAELEAGQPPAARRKYTIDTAAGVARGMRAYALT